MTATTVLRSLNGLPCTIAVEDPGWGHSGHQLDTDLR